MSRVLTPVAIAVVVFCAGCSASDDATPPDQRPGLAPTDHKNIAYVIEGQRVELTAGVADAEAASGSQSRIVTRYFGNELKTDLNGDDREDVVFLLTQERGGSGAFFYVVAALNTETGSVGSDGYLLGDRIGPGIIEVSQNSVHKNVIVVNYFDRKRTDAMTVQPSVMKAVYLKLNPATNQWGIVAPDFEGESR